MAHPGVIKGDQRIKKAFGDRLRELRKAAGFSQEDLALKAHIDRSYVGQTERGTRNVALVNVHKLARAFGIPPHELLMPRGSDHSIRRG
jgi:transcriptional regulator with XRE-family HTH domain